MFRQKQPCKYTKFDHERERHQNDIALQKGVRNFLPGFPLPCSTFVKYDFDIYCALILIRQDGTVNLPLSNLVNFTLILSLSLSPSLSHFSPVCYLQFCFAFVPNFLFFINSLTPSSSLQFAVLLCHAHLSCAFGSSTLYLNLLFII